MSKPDKLVAKGFVADARGNLLVMRRTLDKSWNPGGWDLVGGTVEPGEALDQTIEREGREETGLLIVWGGLVKVLTEQDQNPRQTVGTGLFRGMVDGSAPEPIMNPAEHTEALWLSREDLVYLDDLPDIYKQAATTDFMIDFTSLTSCE